MNHEPLLSVEAESDRERLEGRWLMAVLFCFLTSLNSFVFNTIPIIQSEVMSIFGVTAGNVLLWVVSRLLVN